MALNTKIIISAQDRASSVFGKVAGSSTRSTKQILGVNSALKQTNTSVAALDSTASTLVGTGGLFALAAGLRGLTTDALAVKIDFDRINNTLKAISGSSEAAGEEFGFLTSEAQRLGVELRPLAFSYSRLAAAGKQLGLQTDDTREIFTSFSEAITGLGLGRGEAIGVFTAVEQVLSKGKVSAEEIRQQLGERLPGAFQLAAKAAGVTVQEFDKLLKSGSLLSEDFILPFARLVQKEFGQAAVTGAKLLNAEFNRTINALDQAKLKFIEGSKAGEGLADSLARITADFANFLSNEDNLEQLAAVGTILGRTLEGIVDIGKGVLEVFKPMSELMTNTAENTDKLVLAVGALTLALGGLVSAGKAVGAVLGGRALSGLGAGVTAAAVVPERFRESRGSALNNSTGFQQRIEGRGGSAFSANIASKQQLAATNYYNKVLPAATKSTTRFTQIVSSTGTRIAAAGTRFGAGLVTALGSIINPVNLLIAGLVAGTAVLAEFRNAAKETASLEAGNRARDDARDSIPNFARALQDVRGAQGKDERDRLIQREVETIKANLARNIEFAKIREADSKSLQDITNLANEQISRLQALAIPAALTKDSTVQNAINAAAAKFKAQADQVENLRQTRNQLGVAPEEFKGALENATIDLFKQGFTIEAAAEALKDYAIQVQDNAALLRGQKRRAKAREEAEKQAEKRSDFLSGAQRSSESIQKEADFIKKFGEQNLFKFQIQEKFNAKVQEGLITQDEANRLTREQVIAQTALNNALNKKVQAQAATGFSATTSQDSGFAASRNRERTRQLFQTQDRAQAQKEKSQQEKEKKEVATEMKRQTAFIERTTVLTEELLEAIKDAGFDLRIR